MQPNFTLQQFNHLSNSEKYDLLENHGVYLEVYRIQGAYKIALFFLFGYYVEVWLHQGKDKLFKAAAFDSYSRLDPFLMTIDLSPIYSVL